ncbi:MAG TPA: DUF4388 domain-containing protein [Kofleriaceae bacterium]|nr:DUF4388 domain-containing protein [Kofleriaceae bacterium]
MRRRCDRYEVDLTAGLFAEAPMLIERRVSLSDLSKAGAFLRMSPLPVGEPIHVALFFEGRQLVAPATVMHGLGISDARALGRDPGIGVAFDPPSCHQDLLFLRAVERLIANRPLVKPRERVILRGELGEVALPAILVMLEQEKKSGRLILRDRDTTAWLELAHGEIVGAGSTESSGGDLRGTVMALLGWSTGDFELVATEPRTTASGLSITYALIEHARICDERAARKYVA